MDTQTAYEVVVAWCEQNRAELCNDCLSDGYLPLQTRRALCTIHPVFFPQPTHFFPKIEMKKLKNHRHKSTRNIITLTSSSSDMSTNSILLFLMLFTVIRSTETGLF